jgi:hypothetical protein
MTGCRDDEMPRRSPSIESRSRRLQESVVPEGFPCGPPLGKSQRVFGPHPVRPGALGAPPGLGPIRRSGAASLARPFAPSALRAGRTVLQALIGSTLRSSRDAAFLGNIAGSWFQGVPASGPSKVPRMRRPRPRTLFPPTPKNAPTATDLLRRQASRSRTLGVHPSTRRSRPARLPCPRPIGVGTPASLPAVMRRNVKKTGVPARCFSDAHPESHIPRRPCLLRFVHWSSP